MITDELLQYIRDEISQKTPIGAIKSALINNGWFVTDVDDAVLKVLNEHLILQENGDGVVDEIILSEEDTDWETGPKTDLHHFSLEKESVKMPKTIGSIIESAGVKDINKKDFKEKGILFSKTVEGEEKVDVKVEVLNDNRTPVAAISLGVLSDVLWLVPFAGLLSAVGGIYLGIRGLKMKRKNLAVVGIYLSVFGLFLSSVNGFSAMYIAHNGENPFLFGNFSANIDDNNVLARVTNPTKKVYEDRAENFRIYYPGGWIVGDREKFNSSLILYKIDADEDSLGQSYRANVSLTIRENINKSALQDLVNDLKKSSSSAFYGFQSINESDILIDNNFGALIVGAFDFEGKKLNNMQIVFLKDDKMYLFTGTALSSETPERIIEMRKIIESFAFSSSMAVPSL